MNEWIKKWRWRIFFSIFYIRMRSKRVNRAINIKNVLQYTRWWNVKSFSRLILAYARTPYRLFSCSLISQHLLKSDDNFEDSFTMEEYDIFLFSFYFQLISILGLTLCRPCRLSNWVRMRSTMLNFTEIKII